VGRGKERKNWFWGNEESTGERSFLFRSEGHGEKGSKTTRRKEKVKKHCICYTKTDGTPNVSETFKKKREGSGLRVYNTGSGDGSKGCGPMVVKLGLPGEKDFI